jgi:hypothetical protein
VYAILGRDRVRDDRNARRVVGAVALLALAAYVVTPWSAGGPAGDPHLFGLDLRFMVPALALGAIAAARARHATVVVGASTVFVVWNQFAARGKWPASVVLTVLATVALVGIPVATYYATRGHRILAWAPAIVVVFGLALWGWPVQREAMRTWYSVDRTDLTAAYALFHNVRGARVAVGGFADDYPLYGVALKNRVQLLGTTTHNGAFSTPPTCQEWLDQLGDGHYGYVVIGVSPASHNAATPPEAAWTADDPHAHKVFAHGNTIVFKLNDPPNPSDCARARS